MLGHLLHLFHPRQQIVMRRRGRVADFCPICHEVRAHRLYSRRSYTRLGVIPMSPETESEMHARCLTCGVQAPRAAFREMSGSLHDHAGLAQLIYETNPRLPAIYAGRMELEDRMRRGRLRPAEREALIQETFRFVDATLAAWREAHIQKLKRLAGVVLFVTVFVILAVDTNEVVARHEALILAPAAAALTLAALLAITARARFARGRGLRMIAVGLRFINPTTEQIDEAVKGLPWQSCRLIHFVRGKHFTRILQHPRACGFDPHSVIEGNL
jgi:hypothetical protein